ncbi:MAG: Tn3 family transposase [Streptosporangiaceae bacterium]
MAGISGVFVAGTLRDSLVLIDAMHDQDGGVPPQVIMTDTASYVVTWTPLVPQALLAPGFSQFAPRLADMPDQKLWRIDPRADYGPLNSLARGRIDLGKVERHWADMIRMAGSLHTGAVRAYDTLRVLQRDGKPTALGEAVATYGRIAKTEHMLAVLDDEAYRRQISNQLSIQESRHALARRIFHGQRGELRQRYREGQDQIGALGLVLNAVMLFTTRYMNSALDQLRAQGHPVLEEDVVRLSPLTRKHLNVLGRYSFVLPELPEGLRPLRDPNNADEDEDDEG